jgi:hypothetical protein
LPPLPPTPKRSSPVPTALRRFWMGTGPLRHRFENWSRQNAGEVTGMRNRQYSQQWRRAVSHCRKWGQSVRVGSLDDICPRQQLALDSNNTFGAALSYRAGTPQPRHAAASPSRALLAPPGRAGGESRDWGQGVLEGSSVEACPHSRLSFISNNGFDFGISRWVGGRIEPVGRQRMPRVRRTRRRPRYFQAPSLCHLSPSRYAHHRPTANGLVGKGGRIASPGWLPNPSYRPAISVPLSQTHLRLLLGGVRRASCIVSRAPVVQIHQW